MSLGLPELLGLGLGVAQLGQSERLASQAQGGLSPEQRERARKQGTLNIGSNLAQRGLLDSSLYSGGLADLERQIAEAQNPNAPYLWQGAFGAGQAGGETLGSLAQYYLMRQLFGNQGNQGFGGQPYPFFPGGSEPNPWMQYSPWSKRYPI